MSGSLRDSAIDHLNKTISLMQKGQNKEALEELEKAEEAAKQAKANDILIHTINIRGQLLLSLGALDEVPRICGFASNFFADILSKDPENEFIQQSLQMNLNNIFTVGYFYQNAGRFPQAKNAYETGLGISLKLLQSSPQDEFLQNYTGAMLNNLGNLLSDMGRIEDAKNRYEKALEMREKLLEKDPENVTYQSDVAMTLNNLGILLSDIGRIEEAKNRYEKALEIYTEPMQYLTIGRKAESIIRLIELNTEQAEKETNSRRQIKYLEESYQLCKKNQEFFSKYGLKHEKKLVMEAGLSAYVDCVIKDIREEKDSKKRAEGYEKAIKAVEKLGKIGDDEEITKVASSTVCYLEGRKLVNEALASDQPDLELIGQAVKQFRDAKETYKKANVCYCIYIGLLKILENAEIFEEENGSKAKELIQQVIEILPEKIDPGIRASFEELTKIFDEKDIKNRKNHLEEFDGKIRSIEYKALENLFGHVNCKIKKYFEKPFNLNIIYEKWKLKIIIHDPEKIKGKLTIKAGDKTLFDRALSQKEIEKSLLEIDFLEIGYLPQGEDKISFMTMEQKKPVIETIDYFEKITNDHEIRIIQQDYSSQAFIRKELRIAAVQLKYHIYKEDFIIKLSVDDDYHKKVMAILDTLKNKADIIVFPEFSIPFEFLEEIQKFVDENRVLVIAGSHYVTENNLISYRNLFVREITEEDLMKNISPIVIPGSKIVHNEKYLGASIERPSFFEEGMEIGKVNHILKLREGFSVGIMICYEFLNTEYRHRLVPVCDVILVPQTNPDTKSFYDDAWHDIDRPLCGGNRHFIIANGIFTFGEDKEVQGGSTGTASTLNKHLNKRRIEGIVAPVNDVMEQFVLIAKINTNYFPGQDTQNAQEAVTDQLIQIFEETELLKNSIDNKSSKPKGEDFIKLLKDIENCERRTELRDLLKNAQKEIYETEQEGKIKKISLIEYYSPLMNKRIQDMEQLNLEKIKNRCRFLLIPKN